MKIMAVMSASGALIELAARPPNRMINRPRRKRGYLALFGISGLLPIVIKTSAKSRQWAGRQLRRGDRGQRRRL